MSLASSLAATESGGLSMSWVAIAVSRVWRREFAQLSVYFHSIVPFHSFVHPIIFQIPFPFIPFHPWLSTGLVGNEFRPASFAIRQCRPESRPGVCESIPVGVFDASSSSRARPPVVWRFFEQCVGHSIILCPLNGVLGPFFVHFHSIIPLWVFLTTSKGFPHSMKVVQLICNHPGSGSIPFGAPVKSNT